MRIGIVGSGFIGKSLANIAVKQSHEVISMFHSKIVIDANNYYPQRDGQIKELDEYKNTTSGLLANHLALAKVVKVFNSIFAKDLVEDGRPTGDPERRVLPIAGDDAQAKELVSHLVDQFGFDSVDAGTLSENWRFERAKPAYCIPLDTNSLVVALAKAE